MSLRQALIEDEILTVLKHGEVDADVWEVAIDLELMGVVVVVGEGQVRAYGLAEIRFKSPKMKRLVKIYGEPGRDFPLPTARSQASNSGGLGPP